VSWSPDDGPVDAPFSLAGPGVQPAPPPGPLTLAQMHDGAQQLMAPPSANNPPGAPSFVGQTPSPENPFPAVDQATIDQITQQANSGLKTRGSIASMLGRALGLFPATAPYSIIPTAVGSTLTNNAARQVISNAVGGHIGGALQGELTRVNNGLGYQAFLNGGGFGPFAR
jgi:hypothetical protein